MRRIQRGSGRGNCRFAEVLPEFTELLCRSPPKAGSDLFAPLLPIAWDRVSECGRTAELHRVDDDPRGHPRMYVVSVVYERPGTSRDSLGMNIFDAHAIGTVA